MHIKYGIGQKVKWKKFEYVIEEIVVFKNLRTQYKCWREDGGFWVYFWEEELDKWN